MIFNIYLVITIIIKIVNCQIFSSECTHKKTNTKGVCITIQNCEEAREELLKSDTTQVCGFEDRIPIVCCPKKFSQVTTLLAEEKCKEYSQINERIQKSDKIGERISGGINARYGQFPHMALLGYGYQDTSWDCGGTLISEKFVLTAGHCISGTSKNITLVQLGGIEIGSRLSKTYLVQKVHKYPDYVGVARYHDIALVELSETVDFSEKIMPACLPKTSSNIIPNVIASGFGQMNADGDRSKILQWTNLTYFQNSACSKIFDKANKIPNGILDQIQICYGSKTSISDTCPGDSGGPLQYTDYETSLHRIVGVTSFGKPCGSPGIPGVYTKVQFYIPWIQSVVWGNEIQKPLTTSNLNRINNASTKEVVFPISRKRSTQEKCEVYSKQIIASVNTTGLFPHIVDIGNGDDQNPNWYCDGTLISEKFVLTTGWCTHSNPTFIQLGENSRSNPSTIIKIAKIHTHPNFKYPSIYNDIALLQLQLPVTFSSYIKPACLHMNTDNNSFLNFTTIITRRGEKEIEYQYFNCQSDTLYVDHLLNGLDSTTQFCFKSKYEDKEACRRFGGASLQFYDLTTNLYKVIGVLSPLNLCENGKPRYFTKVAKYIDWIEDIVWN